MSEMSLASESDSGAFIARLPPITSFITSSTLIRRARCCGTMKSLRTNILTQQSAGASVDCVSVAVSSAPASAWGGLSLRRLAPRILRLRLWRLFQLDALSDRVEQLSSAQTTASDQVPA